MIKFILLSDNRSGSHFLQTLLDSHPDVTCHWELFYKRDPTPISFQSFQKNRSQIAQRMLKKWLISDYLKQYFEDDSSFNALGFLFKYHDTRRFKAAVKWFKKNDVKIIHLIRRNGLMKEIAIQKRFAGHTPRSKETVPFTPVSLDVQNLLPRLENRLQHMEQQKNLWAGCDYTEVVYEDILEDQDAEVGRILEFLNVDQSASLECDLVKLEIESCQQMVENYTEVAECLENTQFDHCLN